MLIFPVAFVTGPLAGRTFEGVHVALASLAELDARRGAVLAGPYRDYLEMFVLSVAAELLTPDCRAVRLGCFSRQTAIHRASELAFAVRDWQVQAKPCSNFWT